MAGARLSFDIFCRVVDNFGDIGVCWRLARQLARPPADHAVRLWVDDLVSFQRIAARIDPRASNQSLDGVDIVHWTADETSYRPHQVVIEAFACDPPHDFLNRMAHDRSLWINLEYLSAEAWVEGCHGLPSANSRGLRKVFYFPGFTAATGGLLREPGLIAARDAWRHDPQQRWSLLSRLGVPESSIDLLREGARQVFLFCYPNAPAPALTLALSQLESPTVLLVPESVIGRLPASTPTSSASLRVHAMPFVDQDTFDHLLWSSDLNFVRGEDSLVRALWAGRPLVWQIYPQDEQTHLKKLQAWLDRSPYAPEIERLMLAWNTGREEELSTLLHTIFSTGLWRHWCEDSAHWAAELSQLTDLVQSLTEFCARELQTG